MGKWSAFLIFVPESSSAVATQTQRSSLFWHEMYLTGLGVGVMSAVSLALRPLHPLLQMTQGFSVGHCFQAFDGLSWEDVLPVSLRGYFRISPHQRQPLKLCFP